MSSTLKSLFPPSDENTARNSLYFEFLDNKMRWHCEDNGYIATSYLSESFVMRCFGIVRTIPTSSSS